MAGKKIYAVCWTWRKHRIVKTKKEGGRVLRVWKRWYERKGWSVRTVRGGDGYLARPPEGGYNDEHVVVLHTYDAETRERLA